MNQMMAFHTLRTKNKRTGLEDFELLTMMLSALEWKKHNGEITLVTDKRGESYVNSLGVADIWDCILPCLDDMDALEIDEEVFWAGAKIFALDKIARPCVTLDLDFIVWQPLHLEQYGDCVAVIHREEIFDDIYPSQDFFQMRDDWEWPSLNWKIEPCNAAFIYWGNDAIVSKYCHLAINFMRQAEGRGLPYMVFTEQRLLAMCADCCQVNLHALSNLDELFGGKQKRFTHLWGEKERLRKDKMACEEFCRSCVKRISLEFPDAFLKIKKLPHIQAYL